MSEIDYIGPLETCDSCNNDYPLMWIMFTGQQFLCFACYYNVEEADDI